MGQNRTDELDAQCRKAGVECGDGCSRQSSCWFLVLPVSLQPPHRLAFPCFAMACLRPPTRAERSFLLEIRRIVSIPAREVTRQQSKTVAAMSAPTGTSL